MLVTLLAPAALAAEVVWIDVVSDPDRVRIVDAAAASGPGLRPLDLRAAATRINPADDTAYARLATALRDVHRYESELDGERLIMDDLQAAIGAVGIVRDPADRVALFGALAYQGFAVDRYFESTLLTDPNAAPWREIQGGVAYPAPWVDALALEPDRDVTPYDIAEAAQRQRFGDAKRASAGWLPAALVPVQWPAGAVLFVDGREVAPDAAGTVKVAPGHHYAHAVLDGAVIARWELDVESIARVELAPPIDDASFASFLANPGAFDVPPAGLRDAIGALGGEVWLAKSGPEGPVAWVVTPTEVRPAALPASERAPRGRKDGGGNGFQARIDAFGGWFGSQDLWLQAPTSTEPGYGDVNVLALGVGVGADYAFGPLLVGAGVDGVLPVGGPALTGDARLPVRPYPHVRAGLRRAQLTAGWMFPWYPTIGAIGSIPLVGPLELRPRVAVGLPTTWERSFVDWETTPAVTAALGIGAAL